MSKIVLTDNNKENIQSFANLLWYDLNEDEGDRRPSNYMFVLDDNIDPETRELIHNQLVEAYKAEVEDRDSARQREVALAKIRKFDFMFNLTGFIGLGVFVFLVYAIIYIEVPEVNKHIWIHLIGISEGIIVSIFGYFYGSSMKDKK